MNAVSNVIFPEIFSQDHIQHHKLAMNQSTILLPDTLLAQPVLTIRPLRGTVVQKVHFKAVSGI
jgi:hypothetical protein